MADIRETRVLDVTAPEHVEVRVRADRKVLWVNIDGLCVLRACRIQELHIEEETDGPIQS